MVVHMPLASANDVLHRPEAIQIEAKQVLPATKVFAPVGKRSRARLITSAKPPANPP